METQDRDEQITDHKYIWTQLPRNVVVGHDILKRLPEVCKDLDFSDAGFVVSGPNTVKIAGNYVAEILQDSGFDIHQKVYKEGIFANLKEHVQEVADTDAKYLLAVGGGRIIDTVKLLSTELDIPFVSIPTSAAHDGIASQMISLKKNDAKFSIKGNAPIAIMADISVIQKAPHKMLVAGCGDIISNSTAVRDWILAYRLRNVPFSSYAATLSEMTAKIILNSIDTIKVRLEESAWLVVKALISSGVAMSIAGSSRPASGAEHMFSHALEEVADNPAIHGEQCGIGSILMMYLHGGDWKVIRESLLEIGAPVNADDLGISRDAIIEALLAAPSIRPDRYTILGQGVTEDAAVRLAESTKVI